MAASSDKHFQIGLAMSGAISAGAYTAGVFDFLIEALDQWEEAWAQDRARNPDRPTIPEPSVRIKVVSGASAGAITAAVGTVALADGNQTPKSYTAQAEASGARVARKEENFQIYLPKLYETWVTKPDLALYADLSEAKDGPKGTDFLDTLDLTGEPDKLDDFARTSDVPRPKEGTPIPVAALLNWRLLDDIAKAAIVGTRPRAPRPYVSEKLHVYLTLSNLRGVPYKIPFEGGAYYMISHGDRVHYQVRGLGTWTTESEFADSDRKRDITTDGLAYATSKDQLERDEWIKWKDFSICALASAAFPVGLAPRDIGAMIEEYDGRRDENGAEKCYRRFPIEGLHDGEQISPDWPPNVKDEKSLWFRTADGGIIDNDPFEYARFTLKDKIAQSNPSEPDKADRAVIMISPFPEPRPIRPEGKPGLDIRSIFSALLPSLIDQARFKPGELVHAADEHYASRFLIGPSRTLDVQRNDANDAPGRSADEKPETEEVEQRYGIASGLLGGFGGFLSRDFRDHDFQLGRRNCQKFLRDTFALPEGEDNIIRARTAEAKTNTDFETLGPKGEKYYTLIPLFGTAKNEVVLRAWPQVDDDRLACVLKRIEQRFDVVAPKLIDDNIRGVLALLLRISIGNLSFAPLDFLLRLVHLDLIRRRILEFAKFSILADLVRRNQIAEWDDLADLPAASKLEPDDVRAALAELLEPNFDQRTVAGLVKAVTAQRRDVPNPRSAETFEYPKEQVEDLLAACMAAPEGARYKIWKAPWTDKDGKALYTLQSRADRISWLDRRAIPMGIKVSEALTRTPWKQIADWVPALKGLGNLFPKPRTDPPGVA
jgi:hypothetical protein